MKILAIQFNSIWQDSASNLEKLKQQTSLLFANQQYDLLILPETFHAGFSMQPQFFAESVEGEISQALSELAKKYSVNLIAGVAQKQVRAGCHGQEVRYYNRSLVFNRQGENIATYTKQKLFSFAGEDKAFVAGHANKIVEIDGELFALLVCYDLRFPELFRPLAKQIKGFIVIANWPDSRQMHWEQLLQARAIENQCFVVGVNRIGKDDNGLSYAGGSSVVNPLGERLAYATSQQAFLSCEIDLNEVTEVRNRFPFLQDMTL